MKRLLSFIAFFTSALALAQPTGYYNNATGTGYNLKTQLKTIVTTGHNPQSYGDLWEFYKVSAYKDSYYEGDNTLMDIYSENPSGTDPYTFAIPNKQCGNYNAEGDCYNREHLVPKSYFDDAPPMHNDAHHVVPTDGKVNGWRGNLPFGVVGSSTSGCNSGASNIPCHTSNNSRVGNNINTGYAAGFAGKVFEPIDEFKGDIARTYFYFATRYQDRMDDFYAAANVSDSQVKAMFDGSIDKVFNQTFLNILLTWHAADPVSAKEIAVNNAAYTYQGNRNPFIDHPEYVQTIWGTPASTSGFDAVANISVYPNPATGGIVYIQSDLTIDNLQVVNINGQVIKSISAPEFDNSTYTIENLPQGFYFLQLECGGGTITKKIIVN